MLVLSFYCSKKVFVRSLPSKNLGREGNYTLQKLSLFVHWISFEYYSHTADVCHPGRSKKRQARKNFFGEITEKHLGDYLGLRALSFFVRCVNVNPMGKIYSCTHHIGGGKKYQVDTKT